MTNYHQGEASQIHEEHQHNVAARRVVNVPAALKTLIDTDGETIYIGTAALGSVSSDPVWQIRKLEIVGDITSIQFANGNTDFLNIFDGRETFTYS